ncbi:MAG: oligosaccharide flippase family protein [Candidatus Thiodiazotropha sp.]
MYALAELNALLSKQRVRLSNFSILLLVNIISAGLGYLTTITIANTLGSVGFGELAYGLAIGGVLAANVRFGMDRSLIRDFAHYPESFNETLLASLLARGLLFIICFSVLLLLVALQGEVIGVTWGMFLVIVATALGPLQIANVYDMWEKQGRHAYYYLIIRGIYFILIFSVVIIVPDKLDLVWIGVSLLFTVIVFLFLQYKYIWQHIHESLLNFNIKYIIRKSLMLLVQNKWLWLTSLAALGMTALNSVILKHTSGYSELGVFAAVFQLASVGMLVIKNIARIGRPILAKKTNPNCIKSETVVKALFVFIIVSMGVVGLIAIPYILVPEKILNLILASEYSKGYWVLRLLGIYLLLHVLVTILGQYIVLVRNDKKLFTAILSAGVLCIVLSILLTPQYGDDGAAIALLMSELLLTGLYLYVVYGLIVCMKNRNI